MKKQVLIVCAIAALLFCVTSTASMASDKCVILSLTWNGSPTESTYVWLYENGTFATAGNDSGTWEKFGGSFKLQFATGCRPLYAGTKKQGFFECLSGSGPNGPNYYTIKGTNKKNCASITTTEVLSAQEGSSSGSPECGRYSQTHSMPPTHILHTYPRGYKKASSRISSESISPVSLI